MYNLAAMCLKPVLLSEQLFNLFFTKKYTKDYWLNLIYSDSKTDTDLEWHKYGFKYTDDYKAST